MRKLKNEELNRLTPDEFKTTHKKPIVIVLDNVRSLNNVGSIFRTADAFLIESIYLCGITGCPPHRDIQKTALGATETVSWRYMETTQHAINTLREKSYAIKAIEQADKATMLNEFNCEANEKLALIFGNEISGVDETIIAQCDEVIEIPQHGTKHSFNISVSVGIVLWELLRKQP